MVDGLTRDENLVLLLQKTAERIDRQGGETVLDLSCVHRLDSSALQELEELARLGELKEAKVVLSGVSADVYKMLKLARLTNRFSFEN